MSAALDNRPSPAPPARRDDAASTPAPARRLVSCPRCAGRARRLALDGVGLGAWCLRCGLAFAAPLATEEVRRLEAATQAGSAGSAGAAGRSSRRR